MLCNGILKRRAGTAPILLHDTLCIFDRKVGTPFPPYGEALIFLKTIFRGGGEGGVSPNQKGFNRKNEIFWHILSLGGWGLTQSQSRKNYNFFRQKGGGESRPIQKILIWKIGLGKLSIGGVEAGASIFGRK